MRVSPAFFLAGWGRGFIRSRRVRGCRLVLLPSRPFGLQVSRSSRLVRLGFRSRS